MTGAPKSSAVRVIAELEAGARGVYTGSVGYVSPQAGLELSVAIRTLEIAAGRVQLGVGAGITAGSVPEAEWRECLGKAAPLAAALGTDVAAGARRVPAARTRRVFETLLVLAAGRWTSTRTSTGWPARPTSSGTPPCRRGCATTCWRAAAAGESPACVSTCT